MTREPIGTISVCIDCMLVHANGETGNETPDCEPWSEMSAADVSGPDDDEGFSWSPCDGCGSALGGDRYTFTVWAWD